MKYIVSLLLFFACISFSFSTEVTEQKDVQQFIHTLAQEGYFTQAELTQLFAKVKFDPSILAIMNHPYEGGSTPWYVYEKLFITDQKVADGVMFWKKYHRVLDQVAKQYHVDPAIIIATIGIESAYGHRLGHYRVIDALSTLSFNYPRREAFFESELKTFLITTKKLNIDPFSVMGSYAGAIGQPQFMPSSFNAYAVDFAGDHKIDLTYNEPDVIASIANYYHHNGWQYHQAVASPASVQGADLKNIPLHKGKPIYTIAYLKTRGIRSKDPVPTDTKAKVILLQGENGTEYWLGFNNFYVITRYNPSNLYAMAVYELATKITAQYKQ